MVPAFDRAVEEKIGEEAKLKYTVEAAKNARGTTEKILLLDQDRMKDVAVMYVFASWLTYCESEALTREKMSLIQKWSESLHLPRFFHAWLGALETADAARWKNEQANARIEEGMLRSTIDSLKAQIARTEIRLKDTTGHYQESSNEGAELDLSSAALQKRWTAADPETVVATKE